VASTGVVVIVNFTNVAPAGTVTVAGTEAAVEFEESDIVMPPAGAAALIFTR
jgi:hypothetical protein